MHYTNRNKLNQHVRNVDKELAWKCRREVPRYRCAQKSGRPDSLSKVPDMCDQQCRQDHGSQGWAFFSKFKWTSVISHFYSSLTFFKVISSRQAISTLKDTSLLSSWCSASAKESDMETACISIVPREPRLISSHNGGVGVGFILSTRRSGPDGHQN